MPVVHHRYVTVDGRRFFYREAGEPTAPAVVLLHGFPTSSYMFRHLIPALADRYRVIAPDHLGFGLSDAPPVDQFDYTFDALTDTTAGLLRTLGVDRYAMYVQDYGAPIGWRLALRDPAAITAIISQNGNGYDAGFVESFWKVVRAYQQEQTPDTEAPVRQFLTLDATKKVIGDEPGEHLGGCHLKPRVVGREALRQLLLQLRELVQPVKVGLEVRVDVDNGHGSPLNILVRV